MRVSMTVLPLDRGSPVMKLRAMCDHGRLGEGRGCSSLAEG